MDTKQLMIGDIVEYRNVNEQTQLCKVRSVSNLDGGTIYCEFEDGIYDVHQSTIHPIPLTEEILKKNGFEACDKAIWHIEYGIRCSYSKMFGDDIVMHSIDVEEIEEGGYFCFGIDRCLWQGVTINYIHEVQHALRLTGLSDMADNFKI